MKMILEKIKSLLGGGKLRQGEEVSIKITPYRDWIIMFIIIVLVFASFAGVGGYLFWVSENATVPEVAVVATSTPRKNVKKDVKENDMNFNKDTLEQVVNDFVARETKFEQLKKDPPHIADPSI